MKKSVFVRIMAALGGVALWMMGLCALAETFFRVPVTARLGQLLNAGTPVAVLITLLLAILLCTFGVCCLMMLSHKRAVKRAGFVMQKGENGVIGVSVKSIEGLVQTCVKQHDVIVSAETAVVERRDGIIILLNIEETAGVNIPLAVGALQKQIKQYVNACTGVDVHEVRVMVENTENTGVASPYIVQEPVVHATAATMAELQREEMPVEIEAPVDVEETVAEPVYEPAEAPAEEPAPEVEEIPAEESAEEIAPEAEPVPVAQPMPVVMPVMPEYTEEEDDRPLHQRLFGQADEPVFVPAPPELVIEAAAEEIPAEEVAEEPAAEETAEESEEVEAANEIDANAVLEVVEAMVQEENLPEDEYPAEEESGEYDEEVLAEEACLDGADEEEIRETEC